MFTKKNHHGETSWLKSGFVKPDKKNILVSTAKILIMLLKLLLPIVNKFCTSKQYKN